MLGRAANSSDAPTTQGKLGLFCGGAMNFHLLPLVLLGIRTALKEDIGCTAAELVYGTNLRLPGGYFTPQEDCHTDPIPFVSDLKKHMRSLHAIPPRHTTRPHVHVSDSLSTTTHVFIRHDAVRKPLQPPYDGPYRVLARNDKYYTLDLNGRQDTVSIDRLKPAYIEQTPPDTPTTTHPSTPSSSTSTHTSNAPAVAIHPPRPSTSATPHTATRTTRSGRRVHWPPHLQDFVR